MINLTGRYALVTGGSRGIGAATAVMLAEAGANVAITYSTDVTAARSVVDKIRMIGRLASAFRCRVDRYSDCQGLAFKVLKRHGRIDILVNNAGIWEEGTIGKMSHADWQKTVDINLTGTFNMCNVIVPIMKRQKYGRIINVSSTAGQRGEPFHSHYAASKGGIIAFTKSIGPELIQKGIWVNCVAPGWV
ncbi:MAG: SDR family oxidoreductase, partial [Ignavibacteriae bacterium]|nr:SDR family oxidoreductase [Ignavibacteriota bacterium]